MKRLYFVRHGLSEHNKIGIYSGQTETSLSEEGREQAREAGRGAKDLGIDYIISSPYERALETAQIIASEIGYPPDKIELNDLLAERHFGDLEGTPWSPDRNVDDEPSVESVEDLKKRVQQAWDYIQTIPADTILVASHGSTGRMLRHVVDPTVPFNPPTEASKLTHRMGNAQIVRFL